MADDTRIFSPDPPKHDRALAKDCARRLHDMEEQRVRAREMITAARVMIERTLEMRKPPRRAVLP